MAKCSGIAFILATILMIIVYTQMYSTLSVYLFRVHEISAQGFGYLMSMNAAMVVLFQYGISRRIHKAPPMLMMVAASLLYGIGFAMFGFISAYGLFMAAMAIITLGEMVHIPVAQSLVAYFAPEEMRGQYMAVFGFSWAIPNAIAPTLAGLVIDNFNQQWVWIIAGLLAVLSALAFAYLFWRTRQRFESQPIH